MKVHFGLFGECRRWGSFVPKLLENRGNGASPLDGYPHACRCPACRIFLNKWGEEIDIRHRTRDDYSTTVESLHVVSARFRAVLDRLGVEGVDFRALSNGKFLVRPRRSVFLDLSDCELRLDRFCSTCERFGAVLADIRKARVLKGERRVGDLDFVRSHQEFGSRDNFSNLLIVGDALGAALKAEGLRGLNLYRDVPQEVGEETD